MLHSKMTASSTIAVVLALAAALPTACAQPAPPVKGPDDTGLAGDWSGVMPIQPAQHLIFHVRRTTAGGVETTLDVPERNLAGFPVEGPRRDGARIEFAIPMVRFRYDAVLDPDRHTLRGTVTQGGAPPLPVVLRLGQATDSPVAGAVDN